MFSEGSPWVPQRVKLWLLSAAACRITHTGCELLFFLDSTHHCFLRSRAVPLTPSFHVCVHVHIHEGACAVCVRTYALVCERQRESKREGARGQPQVSFIRTHTPFCFTRISHWPGVYPGSEAGWTVSPQRSLISTLGITGINIIFGLRRLWDQT